MDVVLRLESRKPLLALEQRLLDVVVFDQQVTCESLTGSYRHILTSKTKPPFIVELFELGSDPFVLKRFSRRKEEWSSQIQRRIFLPTPEDVVVQKLRWGRPKDIEDARDVLAVQTPSNLDMNYIQYWCNLHATIPHLHRLLKEIDSFL